MELKDKVVAVTGGGSGIGRALALTFAREGAKVACCGRRLERLQSVAGEIEAAGGKGLAVAVDITDSAQVKNAVDQITATLGPIDVLFNNAGSFNVIAGLFEADADEWWRDVTVNLRGTMLMMRETLPGMMQRDSGVIINMDGGRPVGGSAYGAGKAGVMEMTRICSNELKMEGSNVIVLGAGPGLVMTEMTEIQVNTEAGRKWLPSTSECLENGTVRSPFEVAEKTIEVLKGVTPAWSGLNYGPDTNVDELAAKAG